MAESNQSKADVEELVEQYWSRRADSFDSDSQHGIHSDEQRDAWLSVLETWVGESPREILDAGCGTGVVSLLLAQLGHDVTGIDLSSEMVDRAREKARRRGESVEFHEGNVEDLPFADGAYDVVTARHLIWTLPNPSTAIREWSRVVRPNGHLVLLEGHWDFDEPWDEYREIHDELPLYHGRKPAELATFLEERGLEGVEYETLPDPVLWGQEVDYEAYVVRGEVPE